MRRSDTIIIAGLVSAALTVRLFFAARLVFPPLDDPAFYLQTARNVAMGRGLVSDVIWNYFAPFTTVTHPSHEFWMPLATLLMAASIKLFGDTLFIAQLPGIFCGALLVVLTYALGCYLWPARRRWSVLAAVLIVPGAIPVYQAGSTDSAAVYAVLSAGALGLAAIVVERARYANSQSSGPTAKDRARPRPINLVSMAFGVGLLCGLSYLARSHGSVLVVAIGLVWLVALRSDFKQMLILAGALVFGVLLIVGPWWLRNLTVFGSVQPFPLGAAFAAHDYGEWFNYLNQPSLSTLFASGITPALQLRWAALSHDLSVMGLITFPFGIIGLPVVVARREGLFRLAAVYSVLLWLIVSGLFPVPALTGSFYHSAGSIVPFAALGSVWAVKAVAARRRGLSIGLYASLVLLVVGQSILAWPSVWADSQVNLAKFTAVTQWLRSNAPPDQPVITNEAHSLNYASGYAALTLPNQESPAVVAQLADRYGAHIVVVLGSIGLYPAALDQSDHALKRFTEGDIAIYELR